MAYLIPLLLILSSAAGIFYIVARKAQSFSDSGEEELVYPKFDQKKEEKSLGKKKIFEDSLFLFMEKFFRKTRVRLMKAENFFSKLAEKLHERSREDVDSERQDSSGNNEASSAVFHEGDAEFDEKYWLGLIKHDPDSAYPYKKLGEIYAERGDFSQARSMFRYALKLVSDDSWAKEQLKKMKGKRTAKK